MHAGTRTRDAVADLSTPPASLSLSLPPFSLFPADRLRATLWLGSQIMSAPPDDEWEGDELPPAESTPPDSDDDADDADGEFSASSAAAAGARRGAPALAPKEFKAGAVDHMNKVCVYCASKMSICSARLTSSSFSCPSLSLALSLSIRRLWICSKPRSTPEKST